VRNKDRLICINVSKFGPGEYSFDEYPLEGEKMATLLDTLQEDAARAFLDVARGFRDEGYRTLALRVVLPYLPVALKAAAAEDLLAAARSIQDEAQQSKALGQVASHLTDALKPDLLAAARAVRDEADRAEALRRVAPHLPSPLMPDLLAAARAIRDEAYRAKALIGVLWSLPDALKTQAQEDLLAALRAIQDEEHRAIAIFAVKQYVPYASDPELLEPELLAATCAIRDEGLRAKVLGWVSFGLGRALDWDLLAAALTVQEEKHRANALGQIADHLPEELASDLLAAACAIRDEEHRAAALAGVISELPDAFQSEVAKDLLAAAPVIKDEAHRARVLGQVAPHLRPSLSPKLLAAAQAIQHEGHRAEALGQVAAHLPGALKPDLLAAARAIQDEAHRAEALSQVAPALPDPLMPELLGAAGEITGEEQRVEALSGILPHLSDALRARAAQALIETVKEIRDEEHRAEAMVRVAPDLPDMLMQRLLHAAYDVRDEGLRAEVLSRLATQMPGQLDPFFLVVARAIRVERHRAKALRAVMMRRQLSRALRVELAAELLDAARRIPDEAHRAEALGWVTWDLPSASKPELLAAARAIQDEGHRAKALGQVGRLLPGPLMPDLLAAARAIRDEAHRAEALSQVLPRLPDALKAEAAKSLLAAAGAIRDEGYRAQVLHLSDVLEAETESEAHARWEMVAQDLRHRETEPPVAKASTEGFVSVAVLERQDPMLGLSPRRLRPREGLVADHSYEMQIALSSHPDPRQKRRPRKPTFHKEAGEAVVLRVAVVPHGTNLRFINQVSSIVWGPGPAIQAAVFQLHAQAAGIGNFDVFIDRDCNLLFAARVRLEVADEPGNWTATPIGWDDATADKRNPAKRSFAFKRFSDLVERRPGERALCIAITRGVQPDEYLLTVLRRQAELPMRVKFGRAALDGLLMTVRGTLDLQRRDPVLLDGGFDATGTYVGNYEPNADCRRANGTVVPALLIQESWGRFLSAMATHGRALQDLLFADAASQEILAAIREGAPEGSVVQVWTQDSAKEFLFPWAWVYDGDYRPGTREAPQPEAFWGQRFVIEQMFDLPDLPPSTAAGPTIATGSGIKIHAGVYNFDQLPAHRKFLEDLARPARPEGGAGAVEVALDESAIALSEFLRHCDADLLYFFCHGHTARPPGIAREAFYDMVEQLRRWLDTTEGAQEEAGADTPTLRDTKVRLRTALNELLDRGLMAHDHLSLKIGCLMLADLRKLTFSDPHASLVVLNMCESAQVFPSLSDSLVSVFLSRGARGVIGTEMPMLPQFADIFGRKLLLSLLQGVPVGHAMLKLRREFMARRNPLGLAYTHFGDALSRFVPPVLTSCVSNEGGKNA
jgi:hypothetical protein